MRVLPADNQTRPMNDGFSLDNLQEDFEMSSRVLVQNAMYEVNRIQSKILSLRKELHRVTEDLNNLSSDLDVLTSMLSKADDSMLTAGHLQMISKGGKQ